MLSSQEIMCSLEKLNKAGKSIVKYLKKLSLKKMVESLIPLSYLTLVEPGFHIVDHIYSK